MQTLFSKSSLLIVVILINIHHLCAQSLINFPPSADGRLYDIANAPSASRLENDIRKLANFGTRHTMSDTTSETRGIGTARRWIKSEFDKISKECG